MKLTQKTINDLAYKIVGRAIEVHNELGPGLLESVYEKCLCYELKQNNIAFKNQVQIAIKYKQTNIKSSLRVDILVEDLIIVELKAIEKLLPIHQAQLLTYLKLTEPPKGLLINFNTKNISKDLIPLVTPNFSKLPIK